ncbi:MAG: peptidoglycan editing factor PgeF [Lachnospiraceae bacterium]|nr:peptidoglycan editing factor PgeF [Lachnospiraceae bacterium]
MERKKFDIRTDAKLLLKRNEHLQKFIEPYNNDNRTTYIDYTSTPVIKYKIFDGYENLVTGFSTKLGGVSKGHLYSLNLSFSRGDDNSNVIENHKRFAKAVGYDFTRLVFSNQVHKTNIRVIESDEDAGKGMIKVSDIKEVDGLVTNLPNIPLMTFYADCVPIYYYDKVKNVIGLVHSGWKGTVSNIAGKMIQTMKDVYNSETSDIVCAIGPSICKNCYEVDDVVIDKVKESYNEEEYKMIVEEKQDGKYLFDLHLACKINLINSGVLEENIAMTDLCTCCNNNILYSHRASNGKRGNLAAVMMLKE